MKTLFVVGLLVSVALAAPSASGTAPGGYYGDTSAPDAGNDCQTEANINYTLLTPYSSPPNIPVKTMHDTAPEFPPYQTI